jgi:hypothetical protein
VEIKEFLESGIMETYVMGIATEQEIDQVLSLKQKYPEVEQKLMKLEYDMEVLALNLAVSPPPGVLSKIEHEIHEIQLRDQKLEKYTEPERNTSRLRKTVILRENQHLAICGFIKHGVGFLQPFLF